MFLTSFLLVRGWGDTPSSEGRDADPKPVVAAESIPPPSEWQDLPAADFVTSHGLSQAAARDLTPEESERLRFGDWALRDPRAALEAALARFEGEDYDRQHIHSLIETVMLVVAKANPDLALELGRIADTSSYDHYYVEEIFTVWPEERLEEVPGILLEMKKDEVLGSDHGRSRDAALVIAKRWPADDSEALLGWVVQVFADVYDSNTWVTEVMGDRTLGGVGVLNTIPEVPTEARLLALKAIIRQDPQLGLTGLDLVDQEHRTEVLYYTANRLFDDDPQSALQFVNDHFHQLFDPGRASLAESSGDAYDYLEEEVEYAISEEELDLGDFADLPIPILHAFGVEVPTPDEAQWVSSLENTDAASSRAFEVSQRWADEDPRASAEWLAGMEEGATRDHAIAGFVRSISRDDPAAGTEWADAIAEPELRERFMRVALRRWMSVDPETGAEAVRDSGLSGLAIESLLATP